ncbi:hypothetical protein FSO04_44660 [Paraburkholderia madseniana]|uniref:Uncharacterized protein n=1 Tax=Paraburkholderia madseniana TaxID=2599607 RepID=A0A6N6W110_9BURK|nr:hypothetical protein [Paraburkholderia madseniana]KAE8753528.1 hypothetical protein FSO04_44660 [Paraburkholderia madseniana]
MIEPQLQRRAELLRDITNLGLLGSLCEDHGDVVVFERTPLLLSKSERPDAIAGRAVWVDDPAGWFATDLSGCEALARWMPDYVAPHFYLATTREQSWRCGEATAVHCIACTGDYLQRRLDYDEDDGAVRGVEWAISEYGSFVGMFIGNLTLVNGSVRRLISERCPGYYVDLSKMADSSYYMNHCAHCNAKFGDFFMYSEPGGAFFPVTPEEAKLIQLTRIDLPLLAQGNGSASAPDMVPYCTVVG